MGAEGEIEQRVAWIVLVERVGFRKLSDGGVRIRRTTRAREARRGEDRSVRGDSNVGEIVVEGTVGNGGVVLILFSRSEGET